MINDEALALVEAYTRLEKIHQAFDGAARELEQSRAAPICIDNCGWCCQHNTTVVHGVEGRYIMSTIASADGRLERVLDRCESWLLGKNTGITTYGISAKGKELGKLQEEAASVLKLGCPLLDDKRCMIYLSRPISCRAYGVTRLAAVECPRPLGIGESATVRSYYGGNGGKALQQQLFSFITGLRPDWQISWLLPTIIFALGNPAKFKKLTGDNRITSAKLIVGRVSPNIIWQEQLEKLWRMIP